MLNLIQHLSPKFGERAFSTNTNIWDYNNRMTQQVTGSTTIKYAYDPSGQRIKYDNGTKVTYYPSKGYDVVRSSDQSDLSDFSEINKHIFANGIEIATIKGSGSTSTIHYVHPDHLTGASIITDSNGNIEETLDYYPFGSIRLDEKSDSYSESRKFSGHEFDVDSGLSYMDARYYNSDLGRFISQDPAYLELDRLEVQLIDPQSWNSYAYARNNPLINIDPNGEFSVRSYLSCWATGLRVIADFLRSPYSSNIGPFGSSGNKFFNNIHGDNFSDLATLIDPESSSKDRTLSGVWLGLNFIPGGEGSGVEWGAMWSETKTLGRVENLSDHFARHGEALGFKNVKEYYQGTKNFFYEAVDKGYQATISAKDNVVRIWDSQTHRFASYEFSEGRLTPKTFFEAPNSNYWTNQMKTWVGQKAIDLKELIK